jgi:hypothetical protein
MRHQRRPGPPRVVVDGVEGRDTLYECDLSAAPPRGWQARLLSAAAITVTALTRGRE